MRGYGPSSYGDGFADAYDDWYPDVSDVAATVEALAALAATAPGMPVLELGVGTGRLALPLAARGLDVHGIDASEAMVARLCAKRGAERLTVTVGDMATDLPPGPYGVVFVAYNTFFALLTEEDQRRCFREVASRLVPGGHFVVEAFVPGDDAGAGTGVEVRDLAVDRVVLAVHRTDPARQRAEGQYVELTEGGGVRLRPWAIRWATTAQLDAMATDAGLVLRHRHGGWSGAPFEGDSSVHVSTYRLPHLPAA